jgi:hypothetical protein
LPNVSKAPGTPTQIRAAHRKHNLGSQSGCAILFAQREQLIAWLSNPLRRHGGCTNRSSAFELHLQHTAPESKCENCPGRRERDALCARCPSHAHPEHEINPPPPPLSGMSDAPPAKSHSRASGVAKLLHTQRRRRRRPIINSVSAFALLGGTNGLMRTPSA